MKTVGATYKDVSDQLRFYLDPLKPIVAAYLTITMNPAKVHLWTLLETPDEVTEGELARAELRLMASFPTVDFDFTTIHLRQRNPVEFVPEGAVPVIIRNRAVWIHFQELFSAANARA